jgi:hypothetical protein
MTTSSPKQELLWYAALSPAAHSDADSWGWAEEEEGRRCARSTRCRSIAFSMAEMSEIGCGVVVLGVGG